MLNRNVLALVGFAVLFGCQSGGSDERLQLTVKALSKTSEECLLDVRDRQLKYETSRNCLMLSVLADQYIEAGGFRADTPAKYNLIAAEARATAWAAQAVSVSGAAALKIW